MIGFLRFVGVLNAAVWLGAAVFVTFGAGPAASSAQMQDLLGPKNYPYFSGAISFIYSERFFYLQMVCGGLAILHLFAEWLYFGKIPRRFWLGLLSSLIALNLISGLLLQPRLKQLHNLRHAVNAPAERQQNAAQAFETWQYGDSMVDVLVVAGLAIYLWRVVNPPDAARFISAVKFRS